MPRRSQRSPELLHAHKDALLDAMKTFHRACCAATRELKIYSPQYVAIQKLDQQIHQVADMIAGRASSLHDPWHKTCGGFNSNSVRDAGENQGETEKSPAQPPENKGG